MNVFTYIQWLTRQIFKMLPLSDPEEATEECYLGEFINSMSIQIDGSLITFPELRNDENYLAVVNVIHYWDEKNLPSYFDEQDSARAVFKREIKSALRLLNRIEERFGDANE